MSYKTEELLAVCIARLIRARPTRHIAVGAASPIPAAAAWLCVKQGDPLHLSLLHKRSGNPFTDGSRELFDLTGQGRIDLFFLGGGQIDGQANINLIGTGAWPGLEVRFPGSFGSAFMYYMSGRTILFREEHSPRVLVDRVDHISAPGTSEPGVFRRGHAQALVTGRCVFDFHPDRGRFSLASYHAGESVESIRAMTGFEFDVPEGVGETVPPSDAELALLRGAVCDEMLETYPDFCARVFERKAAA
ncbi:CoA-transferase [Roseococcus thiosulfatophilus]|uniref:CoA-transferase n=1 Tax=Roseococcus thiosulfatophilus TaxID=35813 RepID=UPI001A8FF1EB|nr:CoA-transferase [Roseococcus thiosulfatophilus]